MSRKFQISLLLAWGAFGMTLSLSAANPSPAEEIRPALKKDEPSPNEKKNKPPAVSTLQEEEIRGFADYPPALQCLLRKAIELTRLNLTYTFGSCDPQAGGMDCSGTIYYLLQSQGFKDTPRQSDEMCRWVLRHSILFRTEKVEKFSDIAFSSLKPGDLVFWTGTYELASPRTLPISHVMIYVGKRASDGKPILFGSSDGRSYDGQKRTGVSMFDFKIPRQGDKGAIFGYGRVPGGKLK
jgi:hypothetical protein